MTLTEAARPTALRAWLDAVLIATLLPALAMLVFCVTLSYRIFHPPRKSGRRPPNTSLALTPATVPTTGGLALSAWFSSHPAPKGCVLLCHEWGAHKATKLKYAEFLHAAGYATVLFDLRNHGDSDHDPAWGEMSRRYTDDLQAMAAFIRQHPALGRVPLVVLSFSFSTFPAMHCLTRATAVQPNALIFDSGPAWSEREITSNFLASIGRMYFPGWLRGPVLYPVSARLVAALVSRFLDVAWPPSLEEIRTPMLFICGGADEVVPLRAMQPLVDKAPLAELWLVPDSPHLLAFKLEPEAYRKRVIAFLNEVCSERAPSGGEGDALRPD